MARALKVIAIVLSSIIAAGILFVLITNMIVTISTREKIYTVDDTYDSAKMAELYELEAEYIIVPGCGVYNNSTPSSLLVDRLDVAIELYYRGVAPKLLFSGDHSTQYYNEVGVMHDYAIEHGVREEDIVLDHAGLSTSDTVKRAKDEFNINKAIFVTQEYHLYRTLFLADDVGIDALGVCAEGHLFKNQLFYSTREIFARTKDWSICFIN